MDWTKAKTILILALVVTNIFLVFTYGVNRGGQNESKEDVLISVLENNNITLSCEIPGTPGKMPVLFIEYSPIEKENLEIISKEKKYTTENGRTDDESIINVANLFINNNQLKKENMIFDQVETENEIKIVKYKNQINNIRIEESYMFCYFLKDTLVDAEGYWVEAKGFSTSKKAIIPASEALIIFMSQITDDNLQINIENIELVYWLDNSNFEEEAFIKDTALPTWKILYNGNEKKYIYAYEQ